MEPKKNIEGMTTRELLQEITRMITILEMDNAKTRALVVRFHNELKSLREEVRSKAPKIS